MKKTLKKIEKTLFNRAIVIIFFLTFLSISSYCQWYPNGSFADSSFIDTIKANIDKENQVIFDSISPEIDVNLTIDVFIVNSLDGNSHFNESGLANVIGNANQYFKKIGIEFKLGTISIIPEYEYAIITNKDSTKEVIVKYAKYDIINLFIVDSVVLNNNPYFGYSHFPGKNESSKIFLCKDFVFGNNLTALLGNCFGLLLTHEKLSGVELVSESNCSKSGDFLCDTYADGGLYQQVTPECLYFGTMTDTDGKYFEPTVANIMSDSPDWCKCVFSNDQYRRMKFYYLKYLQHLK